MTRRQRAAAPTVPAHVPTLAEAAAEIRQHIYESAGMPAHTLRPPLNSTLCGQCVRVDGNGQSVPLERAHKPCAWDRCACACRDVRNTEPTVIVGPAMPHESTERIPSLLDGIL